MTARLTIDGYIRRARQRGHEFVGPLPQNTDCKTKWRCTNGHEWEVAYCRLKGCPFCACNGPHLPSDYQALALSLGMKWLGPQVNNGAEKTSWECPQRHIFITNYMCLRVNKGCNQCIKNKRKTLDDYWELAKNKNWVFVGKVPINTDTRARWICDKGHATIGTFHVLKNGGVCSKCKKYPKITRSQYIIAGQERGISWASKRIPRATHIKTLWKCSEGHTWRTTYQEIVSNGKGCRKCAIKNHSGPLHHQWRGGSQSTYGNEWNNIIKNTIRQRDNNQCQICYKTRHKNGRELDVHHIIPARYAYAEWRNTDSNLITLCRSHHREMENTIANSVPLLRNRMRLRHGYKYSDTRYWVSYLRANPILYL